MNLSHNIERKYVPKAKSGPLNVISETVAFTTTAKGAKNVSLGLSVPLETPVKEKVRHDLIEAAAGASGKVIVELQVRTYVRPKILSQVAAFNLETPERDLPFIKSESINACRDIIGVRKSEKLSAVQSFLSTSSPK
jgi:hypothetical protein